MFIICFKTHIKPLDNGNGPVVCFFSTPETKSIMFIFIHQELSWICMLLPLLLEHGLESVFDFRWGTLLWRLKLIIALNNPGVRVLFHVSLAHQFSIYIMKMINHHQRTKCSPPSPYYDIHRSGIKKKHLLCSGLCGEYTSWKPVLLALGQLMKMGFLWQ